MSNSKPINDSFILSNICVIFPFLLEIVMTIASLNLEAYWETVQLTLMLTGVEEGGGG